MILESRRDGTARQRCQNCWTSRCPRWRKDEDGTVFCNACALYFERHGSHRIVQPPKHRERNTINSLSRSKASDRQLWCTPSIQLRDTRRISSTRPPSVAVDDHRSVEGYKQSNRSGPSQETDKQITVSSLEQSASLANQPPQPLCRQPYVVQQISSTHSSSVHTNDKGCEGEARAVRGQEIVDQR
ncbi:hypothetical protein BT69DRAFT_654923 [Atractiella rhizophila]|nr:hypothetical protein BT69DRAFT_654923 [Atractiella rhizophila]